MKARKKGLEESHKSERDIFKKGKILEEKQKTNYEIGKLEKDFFFNYQLK